MYDSIRLFITYNFSHMSLVQEFFSLSFKNTQAQYIVHILIKIDTWNSAHL